MKFEDVVQNGVLQAFGMMVRRQDGRTKTVPAANRAQRLLEYKGERIERSLIVVMNEGREPLIIWD